MGCCPVAKLCLILSNPINCSTPGFPVLHLSPRVCSNSCPLSWWCHPAISSSVLPSSSCPQSFLASGSFPMSRLFVPGSQSIGASASALPMNIQGWFPSGLTGLISLLSKRLSRVFSGTTIQKHQFFGTQPSLWSNSHIHTWRLEKPQFWLYRLWQWGHGFKILTENHISSRSLSRAKMSTKHEAQVKTFQNKGSKMFSLAPLCFWKFTVGWTPPGLPRWLSGKEYACQCRRFRRLWFDPWVGKVPWRRKSNPLQYSCLENPHGERSLVGYSPRGRKEWDTTEHSTAAAVYSNGSINKEKEKTGEWGKNSDLGKG